MKIGIDLDGVIYDFVGAATECYGEIYGKLPPPVTVWDFPVDEWRMASFAEFNQFVSHATLGYRLWDRRPCDWRDAGAARELWKAGHELHFITHRHPKGLVAQSHCQQQTRDWLEPFLFGVPIDRDSSKFLHFVEAGPSKGPLAAELELDLFIEDNVDNAQGISDAGTICYLVNRPWNVHGQFHRVSSFAKFADMVLADDWRVAA